MITRTAVLTRITRLACRLYSEGIPNDTSRDTRTVLNNLLAARHSGHRKAWMKQIAGSPYGQAHWYETTYQAPIPEILR